MEPTKEQIELAARAIFAHKLFGARVPWERAGNSDHQLIAKVYAETALRAAFPASATPKSDD